MIGNDPQYQAWMQTVRDQMVKQQYQTNQAMRALAYTVAPQSPANLGYGPMMLSQLSNALTGRANNSSTALLDPTNRFNPALMNWMMNAPGGQTIGLPGDGGTDPNAQLLAMLSRPGGVG